MCGIIGINGDENAIDNLLEGLRRLEYRGYDSAGISCWYNDTIVRQRSAGKLTNLEQTLQKDPLPKSHIGIAHTRWATHGIANENNAHPHHGKYVALVHNGIIENYITLKENFAPHYDFKSDTDTEIIVAMLDGYLEQGITPEDAFFMTIAHLQGAYALVVLFKQEPDHLYAVRQSSPLVIGHGDDAMYVGSDALALSHLTNKVTYLEDGDSAIITPQSAKIYQDNQEVTRAMRFSQFKHDASGKGNYRHFMKKEIHEQPIIIADLIKEYVNETHQITLPHNIDWQSYDRLTMSACGSAYLAGVTGKYWFEQLARINVDIDMASEWRYRQPPLIEKQIALFISQSGETMDTLEALHYARDNDQYIMSLVNVKDSSIARASDWVFYTQAGAEIGVASTKAFTAQLMVLLLLAIDAAFKKQTIDKTDITALFNAIHSLPGKINTALMSEDMMMKAATIIAKSKDVLFLGRGLCYPIAQEGALKLKEISYIHAEAYAAGEMKHGPIALIDENMPVVLLAPPDALYEKNISNLMESTARGARAIVISTAEKLLELEHMDNVVATIAIPQCHPLLEPILYTIAVQMLAYHTAVRKGTDIDQPRNLAKSVTVE